jgi:hypothetical protein
MIRATAIAGLAFFSLLATAWITPGFAADSNPASISVQVLLAKKTGKGMDNRIDKTLKSYLVRSFGNRYSSFSRLEEHNLRLQKGETRDLLLPDKSKLKLTFQGTQGRFIKINLDLDGTEVSVRIRDGGLFFQGGHTLNKGMMILAISATTTGKDKLTPAPARPTPRRADSPAHSSKRKIVN